jgi:hypothetical protein
MQATARYFGKRFFINQVLEFHRLSNLLLGGHVCVFFYLRIIRNWPRQYKNTHNYA